MAILAGIGTLDMLGALPCRRAPIMATEAAGGDVDVIEVGREPCHGSMTVFAAIR